MSSPRSGEREAGRGRRDGRPLRLLGRGPGGPRRRLRLHGGLAGSHHAEGSGPAAATDAAGRSLGQRGDGLRGGRAYRDALGPSASSHVAAIEMDGGCERPVGFGFSVTKPGEPRPRRGEAGPREPDDPGAAKALATLRGIGALFDGIDAGAVKWAGAGPTSRPSCATVCPGCPSTRRASTTSTAPHAGRHDRQGGPLRPAAGGGMLAVMATCWRTCRRS